MGQVTMEMEEKLKRLPFKIYFKDSGKSKQMEVRRFDLENESVNLDTLRTKICDKNPSLATKDYKIYWIDDEGDQVTITNEEEFQIAISAMKGALFKFEVERVTKKSDKLKVPRTAHKMNKIRKPRKHGQKHEGKHKKKKEKGQRVLSKTNHLTISGDRELL